MVGNPKILEVGMSTRFTSDRQPANPGRKKGSKTLKTMLIELLSARDPEGEWSKSVGAQLIRKAFRYGDMRAMQEIIERIEGKVPGTPVVDQSEHHTFQMINYGEKIVDNPNPSRIVPTP